MTTIYEDDTTGEQYDRDVLQPAGVCIESALYADVEYHPDNADFDELRQQLHLLVDEAVDSLEDGGPA